MSGDGRDEPLGAGGADGGTEPGGPPSRQVPSQGGPLGYCSPDGPGESGVQGNPVDTTGPGRQRGPAGSGSFAGPVGPAPAAGPDAGAAAGWDAAVPAQRERRDGGFFLLPMAGAPPSDADLIQRLRSGGDSAYEELFRRHSDSVRRYARTCCRDAHTADDLTAEVFARTLQAVRGGAGPEQAVRAYLLTTVRRVAASWEKSAKREQLVDDFAVFAAQAARSSEGSDADTLELGADVRAMHQAEQSLAMQAFRSLPERWQAVLWHTTVEQESPSQVAPLFGLTANATAVLASRAREGLKQAYLQAHVSSTLTSGGDCARYADRLGAYSRGGLRMRAERGLRKHLEVCAMCRLAAGELAHVNAEIPALLPVAMVGWLAAGYSLKAAGIVAGGAAGAAGAGAAASGSTGAAGAAAGGTSGGAASEGLGAPAKAGIAGLVVVAAAAGIVWALSGDEPSPEPRAKPPVAQQVSPQDPAPPPGSPEPPAPEPAPKPSSPSPRKPAPSPPPTPTRTAAHTPNPPAMRVPETGPAPGEPEPPVPRAPKPPPSPEMPPPPPPVPAVFQVSRLAYGVLGDGTRPEVRLGGSGWLWQRAGMSVGGTRYRHGVTMHSASSVTIDLNRRCSSYAAVVGVDDLTLGLGSVRFSVYGDGGRLWRSSVLHGGDAAVPVQVGIAGQRAIRLVVEPHTSLDSVALADWAESRIGCV